MSFFFLYQRRLVQLTEIAKLPIPILKPVSRDTVKRHIVCARVNVCMDRTVYRENASVSLVFTKCVPTNDTYFIIFLKNDAN